jgi:hypothetical protein
VDPKHLTDLPGVSISESAATHVNLGALKRVTLNPRDLGSGQEVASLLGLRGSVQSRLFTNELRLGQVALMADTSRSAPVKRSFADRG